MDVQIACLAIEQALKQQELSIKLLQSPEETQQHERALQHLTVHDDLCYGLHQAYHKCWWCAQIVLPEEVVHPDFCQFRTCSRPPEADASLTTLRETCQEMQTVQEYGGYPATMEFCQRAEEASFLCPIYCETSYLGADTLAQKRGLVWMARTTAFFTLFGALHILYDIGKDAKKRQSVYHQLLLAMAAFDVSTGIAWGLSTWPIPSEFFWIHGAQGSTATCTAQAFFVQWGFTSMFYNVSLALYYTLVIVYTYKEHQLIKLRPYLLGVPLVIGTGLALGAIPFYDWFEYGCHFLPPPDGPAWPVYIFAVIPLAISILSIITSMGFVYYRVRAQAQASQKWSMQRGAPSGLQTRVFYQCLWYVLSFLISWPILFAVYLASIDVNGPYGFTLIIAMLAPLQGFNNFCVYLRPKLLHWKTVRDKRRKKQQSSQQNGLGHGCYPTGGTTQMNSSYQNSSGLANRRQVVPSRSVTDFSETERVEDAICVSQNDYSDNAYALEFSETVHDSDHDSDQLVEAEVVHAEHVIEKDVDEDEYVDPSVEIVEMNEHTDVGHNNNEEILADENGLSHFQLRRTSRIAEED
ncbi:hypothetical protein FisN_19Hh016 [Fistulifera solaris]|uniref:Uncharacterized protein n=1 Tax=Fistulifera solaris TaxID=1519565 RepID=A0A1Z5JZJ7_FISSO|nr:hypothetical protein FisN_19Hh016 [Fistulifera solaris]|eukprot:GAX19444.1 hypothetical protein FisN_19Hh016 [Fistulifera solaris]